MPEREPEKVEELRLAFCKLQGLLSGCQRGLALGAAAAAAALFSYIQLLPLIQDGIGGCVLCRNTVTSPLGNDISWIKALVYP